MKSFEKAVYTITSDKELTEYQVNYLETLGSVSVEIKSPEYQKADPYMIISFDPEKERYKEIIGSLSKNLDNFVDSCYKKNYILDFNDIYKWMIGEYPELKDWYQLCRDIFEAWIPSSDYYVKERAKVQEFMYDTRYILEYDEYKHTNHYPF